MTPIDVNVPREMRADALAARSTSGAPRRRNRMRKAALCLGALLGGPILVFAAAAIGTELFTYMRDPRGYGQRETILTSADHLDFVGHAGACFREDPLLPFGLIPGRYPIVHGGVVSINSLGYRGAEFAPAKPPETLRILFVGDSFTFGYGVDDDQTLPRQVEAILRPQFPTIEVINAGFHGYAPIHYELYLRTEGYALDPDLIVPVLYGGNDLSDMNYTFIEDYGPDGRPRRVGDSLIAYRGCRYHSALPGAIYMLPPLDRSVLWYTLNRGLYAAIVAPRQRRITREDQESFFATPLLTLLGEARIRGIGLHPWIVVGRETLDPAACTWLNADDRMTLGRREHDVIRRLLDRLNVEHFDALAALAGRDADEVCLPPNDGHLSGVGNRVVAAAGAPILASILRSRSVRADRVGASIVEGRKGPAPE